jgi:hypothetical protein
LGEEGIAVALWHARQPQGAIGDLRDLRRGSLRVEDAFGIAGTLDRGDRAIDRTWVEEDVHARPIQLLLPQRLQDGRPGYRDGDHEDEKHPAAERGEVVAKA